LLFREFFFSVNYFLWSITKGWKYPGSMRHETYRAGLDNDSQLKFEGLFFNEHFQTPGVDFYGNSSDNGLDDGYKAKHGQGDPVLERKGQKGRCLLS